MQNTIIISVLGAIAAQTNAAQLEAQAEWGPSYGGSY